MARLRQLHPQNYPNSGNINTEFESVIRYINAAEIGNKTIGELLGQLFDSDGEFAGPIEFRLDSDAGLQYRVGTYDDDSDGWLTIVALADIRGPAGQNVGTIEGPFFFNRQDITATDGQTVFPYTFDENTETVVVYVNGVLQAENAYTVDSLNGEITFDSGLSDGQVVTVYSIRAQSVTNYRRSDQVATSNQAVFAFPHNEDEKLLVYRNGILQREGGAYDYTASASSDTITFTAPLPENDTVTIMTVENLALQSVAGLMFESDYTDGNGLIDYSKLSIDDDEIPQAKVSNLVTALATAAKLTVSGTTPVGATTGDLWLDTSTAPNALKFYDGTQWLLTSPESSLPTFTSSNANQYVRVNGTGTALEFGSIDFSSLVPKTYMGAANGVASLDSNGKLPTSQLPAIYATDTIEYYNSGTETNGTKFVRRIWKQKVRLDGLAAKTASGTCSIQLSVDGVTVGSVYAVSSTVSDNTFGSVIEIDGTNASRRLELVVSSASTPNGLEVGISAATVST